MLKRLLVAVVFALVGLSQSAVAEGQRVSLMVNSWPPYVDAEAPGQGVAVDLVSQLLVRAGYAPEFNIATWQRAMEGVRVGLHDAIGATWYTGERDQDFIFSEPYLENDLILLKLRSLPGDYLELAHLQGKRLGVIADYEYGVDFASVPGLTLVADNHDVQLLLNLLNGKVDFVIGDRRALVAQLDEFLHGQKNRMMEVPISLPSRSLRIAASRAGDNGQALIDAFNKALAQARADGSYQKMLARWNEQYEMRP